MSPIEKLSWEILDLILSYLPKNDDDPSLQFGFDPPAPSPSLLPSYAIVCKSWTAHIEKRTFKSIKLRSSELKEFTRIVTGQRRVALSSLHFEAVLPTYSEQACAKFESKEEQDRNNIVFSEAVHDIFKILESWEKDSSLGEGQESDKTQQTARTPARPASFEFSLFDAYSPMDVHHRGADKYKDDKLQWELSQRKDLFEHRYEHSFLQLLSPGALPSISRISSFSADGSTRKISPGSLAVIASKCTTLPKVRWTCVDDEKKYPEVRQQLRYDFAQGLQNISLHSLVSLNLEYIHEAPSNHNFTPITALYSSSPKLDNLSIALHHLSQAPSLTTFKLDGPIVISPALFWPTSSESTAPLWPKLQQFDLKFNICTPSGSWYFTRHPSKTADDDSWDSEDEDLLARRAEEESDTDSDLDASDETAVWDDYHLLREGRRQGNIPVRRFRDYPNDEEIVPLVKAMAKAVTRMPALKAMTVTGAVDGVSPDSIFELAFVAHGQSDIEDQRPEDTAKPRLYCRTGDWRPAEEVMECWRVAMSGLFVKFFL